MMCDMVGLGLGLWASSTALHAVKQCKEHSYTKGMFCLFARVVTADN